MRVRGTRPWRDNLPAALTPPTPTDASGIMVRAGDPRQTLCNFMCRPRCLENENREFDAPVGPTKAPSARGTTAQPALCFELHRAAHAFHKQGHTIRTPARTRPVGRRGRYRPRPLASKVTHQAINAGKSLPFLDIMRIHPLYVSGMALRNIQHDFETIMRVYPKDGHPSQIAAHPSRASPTMHSTSTTRGPG